MCFHVEFKTPLEPFEWDLIRDEGNAVTDNESSTKENIVDDFSP